jgi:hypothetical protein
VSLTSEIRQGGSFARRFIDQHFPHLQILTRECNGHARSLGLSALPAVHENKGVSMLVGTAIDYRVRAYFDPHIHDSHAIRRGLTLLCNCKELKRPFIDPETNTNIQPLRDGSYWEEHVITKNPWYWRRKDRIAERLLSSYQHFAARARPQRRKLATPLEERLCRYCILFAYLDWLGHAPPTDSMLARMIQLAHPKPLSMLSALDANIVKDLVTVSRQFHDRNRDLVRSFKTAVVGPTLAGSDDIGGADCDLVVDGCLIDVKATLRPGLETAHLRQLVGYWLLDYDDALHLSSAAIILLRHCLTHNFTIPDLIGPNADPGQLRREFRDGLAQRAA